MSESVNRPGISPEDVLKQIDYEHIKEDIPDRVYGIPEKKKVIDDHTFVVVTKYYLEKIETIH